MFFFLDMKKKHVVLWRERSALKEEIPTSVLKDKMSRMYNMWSRMYNMWSDKD